MSTNTATKRCRARGASRVTRDATRPLHFLVAMFVLLAPFAWTWARYHSFEVGRWTESDHPMSSSDDEDDE